jgi:hypothetical protein
MIALFWLLLALSVSPFKSKNGLAAENAALRHQLIVLQRRVRGRVQLTNGDRLFLIIPSDYRVRPGRAARIATPEPEPECLCGALGEVGEGGVPVQGDPLWRALAAASAERICRTFSCRTESPREGQCPAVPSEREHPPRRACSMPRATGRPVALLPSGGSVTACPANERTD